jgi:enoyl-CoA hydratase/carnithine racemase
MRYELTDLKLFLEIAQAGNLSAGAAAVHITAPSASYRLKNLEQGLNTTLFERNPRGMSLTPAGARSSRTSVSRKCEARSMTSAPTFTHAQVALDAQGVATVTVRNAGTLNILGSPVIADLTRAVQELSARGELRAVVLRGTGDKAFVAGADIKEMGALTPQTARAFIDGLRELCESVRHCPVPVIARIPGWALGGGLELAAACDIRVAANRAQFGMPEVKVGIPSIIHAALLPRLIGQARAGWLLLTGQNIDAAQALQWGLVDVVVAPERLDDEVARLAAHFAALGPQVLRQQKRLLRQWQETDLDTAIQRGVDEFAAAFATGEPARFMAPFMNRP